MLTGVCHHRRRGLLVPCAVRQVVIAGFAFTKVNCVARLVLEEPHWAGDQQEQGAPRVRGCTRRCVAYAWMGLPLIFRKVASMPKDNATIATKTLTDSRLLLAMSAANAATHARAATTEIQGVDSRLRAV